MAYPVDNLPPVHPGEILADVIANNQQTILHSRIPLMCVCSPLSTCQGASCCCRFSLL